MATFCLPRQNYELIEDVAQSPELQGPEGRQLTAAVNDVWRQWHESLERYFLMKSMSLPEAQVDYRPMPPNRSYTVRVRYRVRGRGKPMPYVIED